MEKVKRERRIKRAACARKRQRKVEKKERKNGRRNVRRIMRFRFRSMEEVKGRRGVQKGKAGDARTEPREKVGPISSLILGSSRSRASFPPFLLRVVVLRNGSNPLAAITPFVSFPRVVPIDSAHNRAIHVESDPNARTRKANEWTRGYSHRTFERTFRLIVGQCRCISRAFSPSIVPTRRD